MFFALLGLSICSQFPADFLFRMHDHDGWFGPKTKFDGYSGHLLRLPEDAKLEDFFAKKRPHPEVIIIPMSMVTVANIDKIISLYKPRPYLQGFIVLPNESVVISPDVPFPNKKYSSYQPPEDFNWNPTATSMVIKKYEFPIVYPPQSEANNLLEHMKYYGSKAGVYLRIYMLSRGNSKKCLKDDSCQFLGGLSLYGSFGKDYTSTNDKKAVWAIANYDTYGLFPYAHVGADYTISGFIALLGAIESFKNIDWSKAQRPLRFAFFDSEEVGYLGSSKFLRDVTEPFVCKKKDGNTCVLPYRLDFGFERISPDDFGTVIEIKSVAEAQSLYVHTNHNGKGLDITYPATTDTLSVEKADESLPGVPPSSVNSFLKKFPNIEHAVLTSYKGKFPENNRYGSPSDVKYDEEAVSKASQTLVKILYDLCGIDSSVNLVPVVNKTIIKELMNAFVTNPSNSTYMQSLFPTSRLPTDHVSLYSGPYNQYTLELKQLVVKEVLADTLASSNNVTQIACTKNDDCSKIGLACSRNLGVCINYTMNMHPAYSDAFEWDEDKWEQIIVNESQDLPFECEANWDSPDLQYITLPSLWTGRITAGIGILLWVALAILLNIFWNYNLNFLQK